MGRPVVRAQLAYYCRVFHFHVYVNMCYVVKYLAEGVGVPPTRPCGHTV